MSLAIHKYQLPPIQNLQEVDFNVYAGRPGTRSGNAATASAVLGSKTGMPQSYNSSLPMINRHSSLQKFIYFAKLVKGLEIGDPEICLITYTRASNLRQFSCIP